MDKKRSRSMRSSWERANKCRVGCSRGVPVRRRSSAAMLCKTSTRANMAPTSPSASATWTLVISNVPALLLSLTEALVLLRVRWQIELVWKLWKMQGQVDEWQTQNLARILCEVYAKLLGVLLQHWLMLLSCWDDPHHSSIGVAEIGRDQVVVLAHGFFGRLSLTQALGLVCEAIRQAAGRSIAGRTDRPSTSRLLLTFGQPGLT